jgi:hypothetical protein
VADRRWLVRIAFAVIVAGATSAGLSLIGIKGSPVLIAGGWVSEHTAAGSAMSR